MSLSIIGFVVYVKMTRVPVAPEPLLALEYNAVQVPTVSNLAVHMHDLNREVINLKDKTVNLEANLERLNRDITVLRDIIIADPNLNPNPIPINNIVVDNIIEVAEIML